MMKGGLDNGMNDYMIRYCREKCSVQVGKVQNSMQQS